MAIAFVQGVSSTGTAGSTPQAAPAFSSSIASGDLIVVLAGGDGGATGLATSVTDTYGNTYTRVPSFDIANAGGTLNLDCFYSAVTTGGASNVVTLNFNDAGENCVLVVQHFNGFSGTPTFDKKSTSSNASSTTCTSGATATTTTADEVVIGLGIHASTVSAFSLGSGYTNLTQASVAARQAAMESKVVSSTGAQTATFTIAAARVNIGGVVTFSGGASTTTKTQTGVARIEATTTRDQTGKGRITATTTRDQTGVANISTSITSTKTQTGISRITAVPTRDQTGVASLIESTKVYSYENRTTLPTNDANLANLFVYADYVKVATDNATYFDVTGANTYNVNLYKQQNANNTDTITLSWNGKSDKATSTTTSYLQIYNYNTASWETLDTDNTTAANTEYTLSGVISSSVANYYTTGNWTAVRVYQ